MKKFILMALMVFAPVHAFAATCSPHGYTVLYVNGILGVEENTKADAKKLEEAVGAEYKSERLYIKTGYNPKKLGGLDDLLKTFIQLRLWKEDVLNNDVELESILNQMYAEVGTQKILLLGHSQGSFYSNEIYRYLVEHGVSKDSVAVYNTGTPASYVAGGGWYLTSTNDRVVDMVRRGVHTDPALYGGTLPVPPNIVIDPHQGDEWGHSFSPTYLAKVPDTIVSDIKKTLSKLKPASDTELPECFVPPSGSLAHKTSVFVSDYTLSTAQAAYVAAVGAAKGLGAAVATAVGVGTKVAADAGITLGGVAGILRASEPEYRDANHKLFQAVYGGSDQGEDLDDLLGRLQGGAVVTAQVFNTEPPAPETEAPATTTKKTVYLSGGSGSGSEDEVGPDEAQAPVVALATTTTEPIATTTDSISPSPAPELAPVPSELAGDLVINEVAWSGTYSDPSAQWIELYNVSSDDIDLATTSLVIGGATTSLSGTIAPHDYMVVERTEGALQGVGSQKLVAADFGPLSNNAVQILLVDAGGRVVDATPQEGECGSNWCAGKLPTPNYADSLGTALPISMERIGADDGTDGDNWASNDGYARSGTDSTGQSIVGTPGAQNSKHWPIFGFFCGDDTDMLEPGSNAEAFEPHSTTCAALAGGGTLITSIGGGMFAGQAGSSTQIVSINFNANSSGGTHKVSNPVSFNPQPGEYFVALWQYNNGALNATFNRIPGTVEYLKTGVAPSELLDHVIIPFTIE